MPHSCHHHGGQAVEIKRAPSSRLFTHGAPPRSEGGRGRPSTLGVLQLITNSNLRGAGPGRSAGLTLRKALAIIQSDEPTDITVGRSVSRGWQAELGLHRRKPELLQPLPAGCLQVAQV
jgi:hypothetical protein